MSYNKPVFNLGWYGVIVMIQSIDKFHEYHQSVSPDDELLQLFVSMPETLKVEVLHYAKYLLQNDSGKTVNTDKSNSEISEPQQKAEKKTLAGCMKGTFVLPLPDDFNAPLELV
jgi:hypothetical protein